MIKYNFEIMNGDILFTGYYDSLYQLIADQPHTLNYFESADRIVSALLKQGFITLIDDVSRFEYTIEDDSFKKTQ